MNCKEIKIHLIDLIDGKLSDPLRKAVEEGLANCPDCQQEYEELKILFQTFQNQSTVPTPKELDDNFYAFLAQEKTGEKLSNSLINLVNRDADNDRNFIRLSTPYKFWITSIAASIALLITAFYAGRQSAIRQSKEEIAILKQEITDTKNLVMLNMLKQTSASDRIKAISYIYEIEDIDKEAVEALINVMNYDKNINVRLEAVHALYYFGEKKEVRQALIKSLRLQTEPNLQIALIETLVRLREKEAINEIQKLMKNEQLPDIVKFKAAEGVGELYKL